LPKNDDNDARKRDERNDEKRRHDTNDAQLITYHFPFFTYTGAFCGGSGGASLRAPPPKPPQNARSNDDDIDNRFDDDGLPPKPHPTTPPLSFGSNLVF
jgi:hypothetical protein